MRFEVELDNRLSEDLFRVFGLGVTIHTAPNSNVVRWSFRVPTVASEDICY